MAKGLRLIVTPTSTRWVLRFASEATGKRRDLGLGPFPRVTLQDARTLTETTRAQLLLGTDPLEHRRRNVEAARQASAAKQTLAARAAANLETVAREHHKRIGKQFRNAKHAAQWLSHR